MGVVAGFALGNNLLELKASSSAASVKAQLVAINHLGSGPIFSGPQQQPFVCTTARVGLGQPIIDNQDAIGIPVALEDANGSYPSDGRGYPTAEAEIDAEGLVWAPAAPLAEGLHTIEVSVSDRSETEAAATFTFSTD